MKILVLGTSNSILKNGYVRGMKEALVSSDFINLSSGASPGVQFAKYMQTRFDDYDLVIFDSVPNDEQYGLRTKGYHYNAQYRRLIFEMLSTISAKTRLLVIGIALRNFFESSSEVYRDRDLITNLTQAQFIDFSQALCLYRKISPEVYSEHPAHPKPELAFRIGFYLGELIKEELQNIPTNQSVLSFRENFEIKREHIENSEYKKIAVSNSLTSTEYVELNLGESIPLNSNKKLIGFFVNASKTNALIELTKYTGDKQYIPLFYKKKSQGFLNIFVPLSQYEYTKSICVKDECSGDYVFKPRLTQRERDKELPIIQLGELVFWDSSEPEKISSQFINHDYVFLNRLLQEKVKAELRDTYI